MSAAVTVVVLAAGLGKRFKSTLPKVLHRAAGLPLIHFVMRAVEGLDVERVIVVVGHGKDEVIEAVKPGRPSAIFVEQAEQLGTGDAVGRCKQALENFGGPILVLNGDCPLVETESLEDLVADHRKAGASVSLLTARMKDPAGYGRIVRDENGGFARVVEESDAGVAERAIDEVSTGIWCFEPAPLFAALEKITPDNAQDEYYLPDAAWEIASKGGIINTVAAQNPKEAMGVNDRAQLVEASRELRARKIEKLMAAGVTIEDPAATYVDETVEIGPETIIRPHTYLEGNTRIGSNCIIGPSVQIVDSLVEDEVEIKFAVVAEAEVGSGCRVGPFAHLRPGTRLKAGARAGTFVEINRSTIGEATRVPHLSYIGDAEVGKDANIGAGTITGNYDGETGIKSKTLIGDEVLTGSGTTIVAPVRLGRGAVTGAGSVVTKDVESGDVVVGVPATKVRTRKPKKGGGRGDKH